jgi:hypothetical protein
MTHDDLRLDEQAISKAAEIGLSTQLNEADKIDIDIKTDLFKAVQGQVDSVAIAGQGLVMQKDIRVQEIDLHTDSIDINPLSALFGQIELNQPVDATARLVLTEQDINRALNSDYIRSKLQNLEFNVEGKTAVIEPRDLELHLPGRSKIVFHAKTLLHDEIGKTKSIGFTATILVKTSEQSLLMESFNCTPPGQGISLELAIAFLQKIKELVNLPYLDLDTIAFRVKNVDVQKGSLTLHTEAHVRQIPST